MHFCLSELTATTTPLPEVSRPRTFSQPHPATLSTHIQKLSSCHLHCYHLGPAPLSLAWIIAVAIMRHRGYWNRQEDGREVIEIISSNKPHIGMKINICPWRGKLEAPTGRREMSPIRTHSHGLAASSELPLAPVTLWVLSSPSYFSLRLDVEVRVRFT